MEEHTQRPYVHLVGIPWEAEEYVIDDFNGILMG